MSHQHLAGHSLHPGVAGRQAGQGDGQLGVECVNTTVNASARAKFRSASVGRRPGSAYIRSAMKGGSVASRAVTSAARARARSAPVGRRAVSAAARTFLAEGSAQFSAASSGAGMCLVVVGGRQTGQLAARPAMAHRGAAVQCGQHRGAGPGPVGIGGRQVGQREHRAGDVPQAGVVPQGPPERRPGPGAPGRRHVCDPHRSAPGQSARSPAGRHLSGG